MAYDEKVAERVRVVLGKRRQVVERKMFGGLAFMVNGHMCCGVLKDELMLRVGPDRYETVLKRKHAREMDFTGRALRGMVYVHPDGFRTKQGPANGFGPVYSIRDIRSHPIVFAPPPTNRIALNAMIIVLGPDFDHPDDVVNATTQIARHFENIEMMHLFG